MFNLMCLKGLKLFKSGTRVKPDKGENLLDTIIKRVLAWLLQLVSKASPRKNKFKILISLFLSCRVNSSGKFPVMVGSFSLF